MASLYEMIFGEGMGRQGSSDDSTTEVVAIEN